MLYIHEGCFRHLKKGVLLYMRPQIGEAAFCGIGWRIPGGAPLEVPSMGLELPLVMGLQSLLASKLGMVRVRDGVGVAWMLVMELDVGW